MSQARSRSSQPLGLWGVPNQGVLKHLPIYSLPPDALHDALNVIVREGELRERPGMTQYSTTIFTGRPMGAHNISVLASTAFQVDAFQNDTFQTSGVAGGHGLILGTTQRIYSDDNGVFRDITDTSLLGSAINHVRITSMEIGGLLWSFIVNGVDTPRKWNGSSATVALAGGTPPLFSDVTTIGDHIIGIIPPYQVRWGNALDLDTWPALNQRVLSDTSDFVVAIRNLGTLGGVVYKSRSLWTVQPFGSSEASFFRIELRALIDGPASSAAIVEADGVHYYMTRNGRIGRYDGSSHRWVADGTWGHARNEIDLLNTNRIFGVFEPQFNEVWFFYSKTGNGGDLKNGIVVCLPRPEDGIDQHIAFPFKMGSFVSAATDRRLGQRDAMLFTSTSRLSFSLIGTSDEGGNPISGSWQKIGRAHV